MSCKKACENSELLGLFAVGTKGIKKERKKETMNDGRVEAGAGELEEITKGQKDKLIERKK